MKHLFLFFCLSILVIISGCESINKDLVSQITAQTTQFSEAIPDIERTLTSISNLSTQLASAPEGLKKDPTFGAEYAQITDKVSSLGMRSNAMKSQYEDLGNKLKTLAADYSTGKIKTEAVKTEFETISLGLKELTDGFQKNEATFGDVSTMFGKLMANYNAKAESK
jgi:chromosome segregation ATPase